MKESKRSCIDSIVNTFRKDIVFNASEFIDASYIPSDLYFGTIHVKVLSAVEFKKISGISLPDMGGVAVYMVWKNGSANLFKVINLKQIDFKHSPVSIVYSCVESFAVSHKAYFLARSKGGSDLDGALAMLDAEASSSC